MKRLSQTLRGRNALINVFELWVALAGIVSGIYYFVDPNSLQRNSVANQIGNHWAEVWSWLYFCSGVMVAYGLLRPSPRVEVAGLSILGSTTAVNAVAITAVFGTRGVATIATLATLTVASWVRAILVYRAVQYYSGENGDTSS